MDSRPHICYIHKPFIIYFFGRDFRSNEVLNNFTDAFFLTECKI